MPWATETRSTARMRRRAGFWLKKPYNGAAASVMAYDVPRFLHLTNGKLYYVASEGGEDCVIRLNTQSGSREVWRAWAWHSRFRAVRRPCGYMLDANAALKERTLSGEESELMTGRQRFHAGRDGQGAALRDAGRRGFLRHPDRAERDGLHGRGGSGGDVRGWRCWCGRAGASFA